MRTKYQITLKKNGKKIPLPLDEIMLHDDGFIAPAPSTFTVSRPIYGFIAKFDKEFFHSLQKNHPDVCGYENIETGE